VTVKRLYPSAALHGQVAHDIGRQIVSGAIGEGGFLPREAELSEKYAVSRQAIREALKVLAAKGLVTSRRRVGTYVLPREAWNLFDPDVIAWHPPSGFSPELLSDLVELRRLIEPAAAAFAATRGTPEAIASIGAALMTMHACVGDTDVFYTADAEFHLAVFAASGNELVERLSNILAPLLESSFREQGLRSASIEAALARHDAIYEAIVNGDSARARNAMDGLLSVAGGEITKMMIEKLEKDAGGKVGEDA
jgi:DNA-binding FadR family transcriptional regulator